MFRRIKQHSGDIGYYTKSKLMEMLENNYCPICKKRYILNANYTTANDTPSLDRLDNSKTYVKGNVNIICKKCNEIKGDASSTQLRQIADWMDKQHDQNSPNHT